MQGRPSTNFTYIPIVFLLPRGMERDANASRLLRLRPRLDPSLTCMFLSVEAEMRIMMSRNLGFDRER